jgi:uroporphyrinogen decarboxylase
MALNHEEPDRVPLFMGTSGVTTLLGPAYERLKGHLGIHNRPPAWISPLFGYSLMEEDVLQMLGSDGRPVMPGPVPSSVARELAPDRVIDAWGVTWIKAPDSLYFEPRIAPLADATLDDLDRHPWPDLAAESRFVGLADKARKIQEAGYASVYVGGLTLFDQACMLRGTENLLADMLTDKEFFEALIARILDRILAHIQMVSKHLGKHVDVFVTACDLGSQNAPLISPACYREMLKPAHARMFAAIKSGTAAKTFFHTCGSVYPLLGDLIEVGVDILNPVQVSTAGLADTARLKREFGKHLTFCGAIDTQRVMPRGTTDEVRAEVRRRILDLAPGGGYIASAVHCIQPDVPPENVLAMCDEVKRFGKYPIAAA